MGVKKFFKKEFAVGEPLPDFLPARLKVAEVSKLLGFSGEDITILMSHKLLEPLGNPPPNGHKYFARSVILQLAENPAWLNRATEITAKYWQRKRQRQQVSQRRAGLDLGCQDRELAVA